MFKSLRWRLLGWHAGILLLVVVGFGGVLYSQVRHARFAEIDGQLEGAARTLEGAVRALPPNVLDGGKGPPPPPDGGKGPPPGGRGDGPPPEPPWPNPGGPGRPPPRRPEAALVLPPHFAER